VIKTKGVPIPEDSMSQKSILVVDDDDDVRYAIMDALELEGHTVFTAVNGIEALKVLTNGTATNVGLIILDLMMPGMTGLQFLEEVRKNHPDIAKIPVVLATAKGSPIADEISGTVMKIKKPFELEELNELVAKYVN
jgi:CheY-like chemotaxis protein